MNYYIIRVKGERSILGIETTEESARKLKTSWEDYLNDGTELEVLPCLGQVASLPPKDRIFHIYSDDEGLSFTDHLSGKMSYINDVAVGSEGDLNLGVPHIEELPNGRFLVNLYLRGWDYFNMDELFEAAANKITEAIRSYLDDISKPKEQRIPTDIAISSWFNIFEDRRPRLGALIDEMEDLLGYSASETLQGVDILINKGFLIRENNKLSKNPNHSTSYYGIFDLFSDKGTF